MNFNRNYKCPTAEMLALISQAGPVSLLELGRSKPLEKRSKKLGRPIRSQKWT